MGSDQSKSRSNTPQSQQVYYQENYVQRSTVFNSSTRRAAPARPPPPSTLVNNQTQASKPIQKTTIITERQRNPYNYVREELAQPAEHKLYPSLNPGVTISTTHQSTSQQATNARPRPRTAQENVSTRYENARAWIDDHYSGNASNSANVNAPFVVVDHHFRVQPSAPPAPPSPSPSPAPRQTWSTPQSSSKLQASSAPQRSSSTPRGRPDPNKPQQKNNGSNRNQNSYDVRCKTCNSIFGVKIFQCEENHSSCQICKQKQKPCGICSGAIMDKRNFDLEKFRVVNNYKMKCPNAADGCTLSFKMNEINDHQQECPYRELKCPISDRNCNWQGKISQLSDHFTETHSLNQAEVDTEMVKNICGDSTTVHLITLGKFNFLLYTKVSEIDRKIYMAVQLIGTAISAMKWNYEIHIYNKREPRRKFQYTDTCRSSTESLEGIMEGKCVVLPLNYAMTFIAEGNLTYKCFIKKEFDDKNNNRGRDRR